MNSSIILAVVSNHKSLNKKFYDITSHKSIAKVPTTIDLDNIIVEYCKINRSRMNSDYAWRIAVAYMN